MLNGLISVVHRKHLHVCLQELSGGLLQPDEEVQNDVEERQNEETNGDINESEGHGFDEWMV